MTKKCGVHLAVVDDATGFPRRFVHSGQLNPHFSNRIYHPFSGPRRTRGVLKPKFGDSHAIARAEMAETSNAVVAKADKTEAARTEFARPEIVRPDVARTALPPQPPGHD